MTTDQDRAHRAWANAERIKRLSDRVVGVGPVGLGLDGVLAWIPGANLIYGLGAGGLLVYEAFQSGATASTLTRMGLYVAADSALSQVPVVGWAMDTFFPGHLLAARALQRDIERRHGRPPEDVGSRRRRGAPRAWPFRTRARA